MPGDEINGKAASQHEAFEASKQDADAKFKDNMSDVDPKFKKEAIKGHNEDGTAKTAADSNERSDIGRDMGTKNKQ